MLTCAPYALRSAIVAQALYILRQTGSLLDFVSSSVLLFCSVLAPRQTTCALHAISYFYAHALTPSPSDITHLLRYSALFHSLSFAPAFTLFSLSLSLAFFALFPSYHIKYHTIITAQHFHCCLFLLVHILCSVSNFKCAFYLRLLPLSGMEIQNSGSNRKLSIEKSRWIRCALCAVCCACASAYNTHMHRQHNDNQRARSSCSRAPLSNFVYCNAACRCCIISIEPFGISITVHTKNHQRQWIKYVRV